MLQNRSHPSCLVHVRQHLTPASTPHSEGRAKAQGNPKHCTRAHALAAYNLAWWLKELEESAPQAWELILSSLQGPETEATRERVSGMCAHPLGC